jgi:hypothetical protein
LREQVLREQVSRKQANEKKSPCMLSATLWFTSVMHDMIVAYTLRGALRFECTAKTEHMHQAQYK